MFLRGDHLDALDREILVLERARTRVRVDTQVLFRQAEPSFQDGLAYEPDSRADEGRDTQLSTSLQGPDP